jgi:hypothetical protein
MRTDFTARTVDDMKNDHPFAAGALARSLGVPRSYGCHFGMRSTLDETRSEFYRGWDAAK